MANIFAWASIDERGKISGGKAGDQTGSEVKTGNYYQFGQSSIVRFREVEDGRLMGRIAKRLANNSSIGYDQSNRASLYNLAAEASWDLDDLIKLLKKKKVECDCSSFAATCINLTFGKRVVPCFSTQGIYSACIKQNPKRFKTASVKVSEKNGFHKGDLVYRPGRHVIINI